MIHIVLHFCSFRCLFLLPAPLPNSHTLMVNVHQGSQFTVLFSVSGFLEILFMLSALVTSSVLLIHKFSAVTHP